MNNSMKSFAGAAIVVVMSGCHSEAPNTVKSPSPVHVDQVISYTPKTGRKYSASIAPYRQVTLSFKSGGFVDDILEVRGADGRMRSVGPGDAVIAGQALARVRRKDYDLKVNEAEGQVGQAGKSEAAARAQVAQAEAAATKAQLDFTRASNLFASQSLTKPDYDSAKAQRDAAQAQVDAARAQLDAAGSRVRSAEASSGDASLARSDTQIAAPFAAYVVQRQVEIGALVAPGSPAFAIADLSSVKAVFGLPDIEVASLKTGAALSIAAEALPGREFRGIVTSISPVADTNTRLFPVEITVPNPQRALLAGMIATVEPGVVKREPALVAPLGAVVHSKEPGRFGVMVVEESGGAARAVSRSVTLGETFGNRIQITSGLRAGERVVTSGPSLLADGEPVRIIP